MGPRHLGLGFAAKRIAPKVPLWALLASTEVLDLLFGVFQAAGLESMAVTSVDLHNGMQIVQPGWIPWSHGLLTSAVWSILAAIITYLWLRDTRSGFIIGFLVFSHWVLDFIVHLPDLPVFFGNTPLLGLGLWGSGIGLVLSGVLEMVLLVSGIAIYWTWKKQSTKMLH